MWLEGKHEVKSIINGDLIKKSVKSFKKSFTIGIEDPTIVPDKSKRRKVQDFKLFWQELHSDQFLRKAQRFFSHYGKA